MGKIAAAMKWVLIMVGFFLALWLPLVACFHSPQVLAGKERLEPIWITTAERLRLARYHGTHALKITEDSVYIWRDNKWISVLKRKLPDPLGPAAGSAA